MSEQAIALPRPRTTASPITMAMIASAAAIVALRIAILFRYRIDSDETQHLHVIWGWTHGLVPYRDLFDNHMPLFHLMSVPLLLVVGERPEVLIAGRLAMLPFFALLVLLTYRIAESCYERRAAIWATLIGTLTPLFFLCSVEFRPDVLWAACWMATLSILVMKPVTFRRAVAAGFFFGIAAAISAKTSLLAASLAVAAIVTFVVTRDDSLNVREIVKRCAGFIAAALLPPAIIAASFAAIGAWQSFLYCIVTHNLVASEHPHRIVFIIPSIAIITVIARRIMRDESSLELRRRRLFLFLAASIYGAALISFWPIIESEHWLPFFPAFAAAAVPLAMSWSGDRWPRFAYLVVAIELFQIIAVSAPWRDHTVKSFAAITQTLRLTQPDDYVVDLKGDLVFRPRATFAVFEKITKTRIWSGRVPDTIAADVIRTRAMVVGLTDPGFPRRGRTFLLRNFVPVGAVRVAGMIVPRSGPFRIEVPGEYSVVAANGSFRGKLDGTLYSAPRFLGAGLHTLASDSAEHPSAVIWSRAAAYGLTPFVRMRAARDRG